MKRLFIGNINYSATSTDLTAFFSPLKTENAKIISDRETGRSRGFGFIEVEDADLEAALAKDGSDLKDRPASVRIAEEKRHGRDRRDGHGNNGRSRSGKGRREDYSDAWKD